MSPAVGSDHVPLRSSASTVARNCSAPAAVTNVDGAPVEPAVAGAITRLKASGWQLPHPTEPAPIPTHSGKAGGTASPERSPGASPKTSPGPNRDKSMASA